MKNGSTTSGRSSAERQKNTAPKFLPEQAPYLRKLYLAIRDTLSNMTLSNMTLSNMTLSNMTLSNMTLSNMTGRTRRLRSFRRRRV